MLYIVNDSHNSYFNMAVEEYLLYELELGEHYLTLWQNKAAVVVGRNQNSWDEVNLEFIKEHNVAVVRRLTGGGAVYHDQGNLNFTFIFKNQKSGKYDFASFMAPVVEALKKLGLPAAIDGRNDITINGKKVSGNSQYRQKDRVIHHGTLLFDVDLDNLENSLKVSHDKLAKRGVSSVRSRVINIRELLSFSMEMVEFKGLIKEALMTAFGADQGDYHLTPADLRRVEELKRGKYETWEWNFGASPSYNIKKSERFPWGKLEIFLDVRDGVITGCKIYGDFFGRNDLLPLEKSLENVPFQEDEIRKALQSVEPDNYIPGLNREVFCDLLSK